MANSMSPTIVEPNLYWPFSKLTIMTKSRLQKTNYNNQRMAKIECIDSFFMEKRIETRCWDIYIYLFKWWRFSVLGQFSRQEQTHGSLDFPAGDGWVAVVVGQTGSLGGDALEADGVKTGDGRGWYFTGLMCEIMNNFIERFNFVEMEAFENNSTWCRILCLGLINFMYPFGRVQISLVNRVINFMSKLESLNTQLALYNNNII